MIARVLIVSSTSAVLCCCCRWGIYCVGMCNVEGDEIDLLVCSNIVMSGYEELLEEFFFWLRNEYLDVLVINFVGNGFFYFGCDEYCS